MYIVASEPLGGCQSFRLRTCVQIQRSLEIDKCRINKRDPGVVGIYHIHI